MAAARKSAASTRPAGLVLAGGLGKRMGGEDKALTMLGKRPLLAHVLGRLAAQTGVIAISANGDPARFADFGRPLLADTIEGHPGPLAGLLSGMIWARGVGAAEIVSVPTDAPFIPGDLVARLAKASARQPGVPALAASGGRRHPVVGLWPVSLAGRLLDFLLSASNHRVSAFADANQAVTVEFPMIALAHRSIDPFFNINTPDDLAAAETVIGESGR